jgi:diguanylate cyclase (GGDEF)-like protein
MAEFARMTSRDTRVLYEAKKRDQGAKRPEHGFIMVDLDHFKAVNDTYGHAAGDEVLKESVLRISKLMRDTDLIARRGGEEFLITLAECPIKNAIKLAEEMRKSIEEKPFSIVDQNGNKRKITVHASFGVTSASTPAMRNRNGLFAQFVESIISAADKALYIAKGDPKHKNTHPQVKEKIETGRNRTKFRRFYPQISQP